MSTMGALRTMPVPVGRAADAAPVWPAKTTRAGAVAARRRTANRPPDRFLRCSAVVVVEVDFGAARRSDGMKRDADTGGDLSSVGHDSLASSQSGPDSLLVGWTPHLCIQRPSRAPGRAVRPGYKKPGVLAGVNVRYEMMVPSCSPARSASAPPHAGT